MNLNESEFLKLSDKFNIIPLYREIIADLDTPVGAFLKLNRRPSFLLESVQGGEKWGRFSFVGIEPMVLIKAEGRNITVEKKGSRRVYKNAEPFIFLRKFFSKFKPYIDSELPRFFGGMVGFISYDTVKLFEKVPDLFRPSIEMPDIFLMIPETVLIFDNLKQSIKIVYNAFIDGDSLDIYRKALKKIDDLIADLKSQSDERFRTYLNVPEKEGKALDSFSSNFSKEDFISVAKKAKEYVLNGDVVQVVISQRFEAETKSHPFDIYRILRIINPSPYMFYIDTGDAFLVGSSPEILVRVEDEKVIVRPIAGTRPRGKTEEEDLALEKELLSDEKELAEHIMLVDLGRNDVGRVSQIGSVKVTELMVVERYSHVMHIVSNVEGKLKKGLDMFDVFVSCFPAGTVTGAPKVRAMQIIEELEPTRRGPYAGAIGYFGFSGNMDMCIGIRMLTIKNNRVYVQAGAGIVADSVPENEYNETVNKATAMLKAVSFLAYREQA
ncbi:MAG: anthranilate synthase component I [Thermodesulfovibrio sp.]|nr:anthranilate synthase component I [Thermodesulfovibrio sp.]MDW7998099.1 anthranilate synthase component I [Thermodesulfovibrio sp.]